MVSSPSCKRTCVKFQNGFKHCYVGDVLVINFAVTATKQPRNTYTLSHFSHFPNEWMICGRGADGGRKNARARHLNPVWFPFLCVFGTEHLRQQQMEVEHVSC